MKRTLLLAILLVATIFCRGQRPDLLRRNYVLCLDSIKVLLEENSSFKKAVFISENCFLENRMRYEKFDSHINQLVEIIKLWQQANPLSGYRFSDSVNFQNNFSVFKFLKDTTKIIGPEQKMYNLLPYGYSFNDFFGRENWSNMFVTKLLSNHEGNCHSLPYLYKILADELKATCWLSLAPNHIYIKNRCKEIGWYNTELTSGQFPIDAWITASGYIPLKAIQSGIYMDTLSNQQAIALCVLDLAKGYEFQTKNYYDGFILKCCNLVLQYHPVNAQALLLKAETFKRVYEKQEREKDSSAQQTYNEMEQLYVKLFDLGYREMPDKMYQQWLASLVKERDKYTNKKVSIGAKLSNASTKKK
jgi:hypothetical protein